MRHILVIFALIVTAWAFLPGAAQAHDMPQAEMGAGTMDSDCANCPGMEGTDGHTSGVDCHHAAGCGPAVHALPVSLSFTMDPVATRTIRPDDTIEARSITLARDLPPPRS